MKKKNKGFTLLELVIIVAILAITAGFAGPAMTTMIADSRISSGANDFVAALQFAKTEAAARISTVSICMKNDSNKCDAGQDWRTGWVVFVDDNADGTRDDNEEVLLVHEALNQKITFRNADQVKSNIIYQPSGTTSITAAQVLMVCDDRGFIDAARGVLVTITGRGSVMKAADSGVNSCL